ncbi:hypothetical protein F5Y18DRAFT_385813 [Xylariaceae sp. FL1019]|nr:hypothetical protein F5Y18DRAFT_385813 [Xylariaceae sp. FL1019]
MYKFTALAALAATVFAQSLDTDLQSAGFNSTFRLTSSQIAAANLTAKAVVNIENTVRFDQSQLAFGGPAEDDFYTLPPLTNDTELEPGVLLKVQDFTNLSSYVLPPNTALSRILYTTTNLNGTVLPASAFVLWPFYPKQFSTSGVRNETGAPVILWTHGTSGFFASHGPSAMRNLWYADAAPFSLALSGYAVVAPDYAGLGIHESWDGSEIPHQYLMSRVSAHDALYSLRAAWDAFPGLLKNEFVAMGHSQGGGVAWGVSEVLAAEGDEMKDLVDGFRGTVSGSPTTDVFTGTPQFIVTWISMFLDKIFPSFKQEYWVTDLGIARTKLQKEIEGGISVSQTLYLDTDEKIVKDGYDQTWYVEAYGKLANVGQTPFLGPMIVIQGTNDIYIPYEVTNKTVGDNCAYITENNLDGDLEFLVVNGTGHVPTLDATRPIWMQWIEDRFEGKPVKNGGCVRTDLDSFLPLERYLAVGNSYVQWAGGDDHWFETVLGL